MSAADPGRLQGTPGSVRSVAHTAPLVPVVTAAFSIPS